MTIEETRKQLADMFPGAKCHAYPDGTIQAHGDGWRIGNGDPKTRFHTLYVGGSWGDDETPATAGEEWARATVALIWAKYFTGLGRLVKREAVAAVDFSAEVPKSPETEPERSEDPRPSGIRSGAGIMMSNDDYHAADSLGSTTIKRALIHPARMSVPSGINPQTAEAGNRAHCAVCEGLDEMHRRYCVAPAIEDYPGALKTSEDLRGALRDAKIKGYSKLKSAELVAMVRDSIPGALLWADVLSEFGSASSSKTWVSQDEWDDMERIREAVLAHDKVREFGIFDDGIGESSWFADVAYDYPGIYGRLWPMKCRPDWLQDGRVSDLKTWAGGKPVSSFLADASRYHYDLSAALYIDVLREHRPTPDVFSWVIVDKSTLKTGGRVIVHVATLSPRFLAQGREKLAHALDRINDWETSPAAFNRQDQIEHIAEPPAWGWR